MRPVPSHPVRLTPGRGMSAPVRRRRARRPLPGGMRDWDKPSTARPAGRTAQYATACARCPEDILPGAQYVLRRGEAVHPGCVNGADDA